MFWTRVSGTARDPGQRVGPVPREPTPATRSIAGVESQRVQEGHRRGPSEGGERQPAGRGARGFAVRRAHLRAVQERARPRLDPLPPVRDGGDPRAKYEDWPGHLITPCLSTIT